MEDRKIETTRDQFYVSMSCYPYRWTGKDGLEMIDDNKGTRPIGQRVETPTGIHYYIFPDNI